jgi:tyrosyl-tRNA synthetase
MPTVSTDPKRIDAFLARAVENVFPSRDALREVLLSGKRLRVYYGIDPTGPTIHLGHTIPLRKFAELQKMGHEIILLIGDFTAMIGDPTDKSATRKQLTKDEVLANMKLYKEQAAQFLEFDGPNAAQFRLNSEWLAKMSFADVLELASHFTVQQMLERDMFDKRMKEQKPIHLHEFLYPLMQGYDSVALDVDMELCGNDQTFNALAGRTLMRELKKKNKFVFATKILADPSGKKMGKSEGNMIAMTDAPEDMYGKVMSWPDAMIAPAFEVCTNATEDEVKKVKTAIESGVNPMTLKRELARQIVTILVDGDAAEEAEAHFSRVHQDHERPEEILEMAVEATELPLVDALVFGKLVASKSEARRQVEQGGVKVDDVVVTDTKTVVKISADGVVLQKGKRHFVKLVNA